jgi:lysophospholipase L1-like esterase
MRVYLLTLLILIITLSCNSVVKKPVTNTKAETREEMEQDRNRLKYLALGDSYTIGESVDSTMRYPVQIADSLKKLGYLVEAPEIIAVTGWTTSNLKEAIVKADPQPPYDLVSLLIGVNNQYRGLGINIYITEFSELIDQAIHFAGNDTSRVIVLSIPDWGVTPFASDKDRGKIAREIDQYNAINKRITLSRGITWIDVTGISRLAEKNVTLIAGDGLHPSGKMYTEWMKVAVAEIVKMLKEE